MPRENNRNNLNVRQVRFKELYLGDDKRFAKNAYKCALEAGYSESYAKARSCELLDKLGITEEIKEINEKVTEDLGITFEWVANALKKNYELALTPDGETGRIDVRASSDALKELNKMFGHNAPEKREISSEVKIVPDFGDGGDDL